MNRTPVILGGSINSFPLIPFVRPEIPQLDELQSTYQKILQSRMVTTGPFAEEFASKVADFMGVTHAVATSSCTSALMLGIESLQLPAHGEVIMPSFTFMASGLAPMWNRLHPVFVDVDRNTMNLCPDAVRNAITERTVAVLAVHQFGNPAPVDELVQITCEHNIALMFDSAHGLGSLYKGRPLGGAGSFEAFSLSPTKLVVAGEGGILSTSNPEIAERVRYGRNYANPGNYDCMHMGMNARMSELHAVLGIHSFKRLENAAQTRNRITDYYRTRLANTPGITFQDVNPENRCSYKDFCIVIDSEQFGLTRDQLVQALHQEELYTRVYYKPILHEMTAFCGYAPPDPQETLANSLFLRDNSVCIPLYSDMTENEAEQVCETIEMMHAHSPRIAEHCTPVNDSCRKSV